MLHKQSHGYEKRIVCTRVVFDFKSEYESERRRDRDIYIKIGIRTKKKIFTWRTWFCPIHWTLEPRMLWLVFSMKQKHVPQLHRRVNNLWNTFVTWPIRIVLRNHSSKVVFSVGGARALKLRILLLLFFLFFFIISLAITLSKTNDRLEWLQCRGRDVERVI